MNVKVCCIAKMENPYIREYVQYYQQLGVDNIVLYDNNDIDGEKFEDVIGDYIENGFVIIENIRGVKGFNVILQVYQHCYDKYNKTCDWIMYMDVDEFFTINDGVSTNIKEYFSKDIFKDFQMIHPNWRTYDDNDLLYNDGRGVLERFTHPAEGEYADDNKHIKTFIRGGLDKVAWVATPHTPIVQCNVCNANGIKIENGTSPFNQFSLDGGYIKHFGCKTISEYCCIKATRLCCDINAEEAKATLTLDNFFSKNKWTKEKEEIGIALFRKYRGEEIVETKNSQIAHFNKEHVSSFIGTIQDINENDYDENSIIIQLGDSELKNEYTHQIIHDNTLDNISYLNKGVCEFTGMYWVHKNFPLKEYVMFNQYRILLDTKLLDIGNIFKTHDIILPNPINFDYPVIKQYQYCHNVADLIDFCEVLDELYPEYRPTVLSVLKNTAIYANNLFIMKKDDFNKFCEFANNVLQEFLKRNNINTYEDCIKRVEDNKEKYLKYYPHFEQNSTVDYQSRFLAYLMERLFNIYVLHNFHNIFHVNTHRIIKKYELDTLN